MLQPTDPVSFDVEKLRTGLIDGLRASRAAERAIFDALEPAQRDAPGFDGDWSAKDVQAHLSAWRQRQSDRMLAQRGAGDAPAEPDITMDQVNANFHAERADWPWDRVAVDAEATAEALIAEVAAADGTMLADPDVIGPIMGDGAEHDLDHLARVAAVVGMGSRVLDLADTTLAILDRGGWPSRSEAYARYNLACFHAKAGNLDVARSLLRQALPAEAALRANAPVDDDLIALRDEIPALADG
jgi:hypothetical protein